MKKIMSAKSALVLLAIGVGATTFVGCNKIKDFGTINTRDDASAVPVTSYLLTNVQANLGSFMTAGTRPSEYTQQYAETQYTDVSVYGTPQVDYAGTYSGVLQDLQTVIDLNIDPATKSTIAVTSSGSNANQIAVARILKSYILWTITDRWGDVPYSQALKGAANLSPKFDKQEDIYKGILGDLKAAIAGFDGGPSAKGDILYGGNNAKWKKLANTIRMLMALRMSKVYPNAGEFAATEFAAAANDANGAIITNADNLTLNYDGATALTTNVWYSALVGRKDDAFSLTFSDILSNLSDNRRASFATPGPGFAYGLPRALAVAFDNANAGSCARLFAVKTQTTPIVIVPAAYTLLAQAEAVQRGWLSIAGKTAQTLYEAGVTASFAQWGASGAVTYLTGSANFLSGSGGGNNIGANTYGSIVGANAFTTTPLQRIQLQRFIASFGDGIQAWSEWRRTGIPNLTPTTFGTNSPKEIPRRYTYGLQEYGTNTANVNEAAGRISGGDKMNSRVWWDKP